MNNLYRFIKKGLADSTTKSISFSSWNSGETSNPVWINHLLDFYKKCPVFYIDDDPYLIKFSPSTTGRGGMDEGSPETITVTKLEGSKVFVSTKDDYVSVVQLGFDVAYKEDGKKDIEHLMGQIEDIINNYYDITGANLNFRVVGKGWDGIDYDMEEINKWNV